jgi:hypothetical protein
MSSAGPADTPSAGKDAKAAAAADADKEERKEGDSGDGVGAAVGSKVDDVKKRFAGFQWDKFAKSVRVIARGVMGLKPDAADIGAAAPAGKLNTSSGEVMVVQSQPNRWERLASHMQATPLIQFILEGAKKLSESEVGKAAAAAKTKVQDAKEVLQEKWDTSQHP